VDNFVDNATLDRPKRGPQAGFNRMPVVKAKRESNEIKHLQPATHEREDLFWFFQV
jgi:hypothetical protein